MEAITVSDITFTFHISILKKVAALMNSTDNDEVTVLTDRSDLP